MLHASPSLNNKELCSRLTYSKQQKCEGFAEYLLPPKCQIQHIMCLEGKTEKDENNYAVQLGKLLPVTAEDFLDSWEKLLSLGLSDNFVRLLFLCLVLLHNLLLSVELRHCPSTSWWNILMSKGRVVHWKVNSLANSVGPYDLPESQKKRKDHWRDRQQKKEGWNGQCCVAPLKT